MAAAGGYRHSLALKADGTVAAWGFNSFGQTNVPAGLSGVASIAGGYSYSLALKSNGTVVAWGNLPAPSGLSNVTAIAAGWYHSLALKSDGTIVAWGANGAGQATVPVSATNIIAIAAGQSNSLALRADGALLAWGDNSYGQTNVPSQLTNVATIAAGANHYLALNHDGSLVAWGANSAGQATVPRDLTNAVAVVAGALHSLGLRMDGTLDAWGDNTYNQTNLTPGLAGFYSIAAGGFHNLALRGNGAPLVLVPPATQTAAISQSVILRVLAVGAEPLGFQWIKNGTNSIPGATNSFLMFNSVSASDAGSYAVVVSNYVSAVLSASAVLTTLAEPPSFVSEPQNPDNVVCGDNLTLSVRVYGTLPFSFQWQFDATNLTDGPYVTGSTTTNLTLLNVQPGNAGNYRMIVSNAYGAITSSVATVTVTVQIPAITSPLSTNIAQGQYFAYDITALHTPTTFGAIGLPPGVTIDTASGIISGVPTESGTFGVTIAAMNACSIDQETLVLNISSSVPVITSPLTATGTEDVNSFTYQITATQSPTSFGATNLPIGLFVDPNTGIISGTPALPGTFYSTILASNRWGYGSATLQLTIQNAPISGLSIVNVTYHYAAPYLLDFQFGLRNNNDPTQGDAVIADPSLLSADCFEDSNLVLAADTGIILQSGTELPLKAFVVLDFAQSVASFPGGIAQELAGAESFVGQQPPNSLIGVYEFHRDDQSPQQVIGLTNNPVALETAIEGIPTNFVQGFSSGSRLFDAVTAAITNLVGSPGFNRTNQQNYVIVASDGVDESSIATLDSVIGAATNADVQIYCLGFGDLAGSNNLIQLASQTSGRYYAATALPTMQVDFDLISKDLNGQYILRWATLKRAKPSFMPSFQINYQGLTANSPTNPVMQDTNNPIIDTNSTPPTTNYNLITNYIIAPYVPPNHSSNSFVTNVTVGEFDLRPVFNGVESTITLNAFYVPRDIYQIHVHYHPNWACSVSPATNSGQLLYNWSMTVTNDGTNGFWITLSNPNPPNTGIPFASFGDLLTFTFLDQIPSTNGAFSVLAVDNTIYTNTGGQVLLITNLNPYVTLYPLLPYGTPVPWLIHYGFTNPNNWTNNEISDSDGDGMLNWQEYRANTDPTNKLSKFYITDVSLSPDNVRYQVTFSTSQERTYRLQSSTDLQYWQIVQDNIPGVGTPGTNKNVTIVDQNYYPGATKVFYRVLVY